MKFGWLTCVDAVSHWSFGKQKLALTKKRLNTYVSYVSFAYIEKGIYRYVNSAGSEKVALDNDTSNNKFSYRQQVRYSASLFLRG